MANELRCWTIQVQLAIQLTEDQGSFIKKIEAGAQCTIEMPRKLKDPAGFDIMVKSWNPVFLGLGLRAVAAAFKHDESAAVSASRPMPAVSHKQFGPAKDMEWGKWEVSGGQVSQLTAQPIAAAVLQLH